MKWYDARQKKKLFRKKKWKFLRRKQFKGKTSKVYFVCRRPSHFAKNCPKKEKATKLLEKAQIHANDIPFLYVESLFSLDDDYSPQALVVMAYSTSEEDLDPNDDDDLEPEIQTIYTSIRTYVVHMLRTYIILYCNGLILGQNALYL